MGTRTGREAQESEPGAGSAVQPGRKNLCSPVRGPWPFREVLPSSVHIWLPFRGRPERLGSENSTLSNPAQQQKGNTGPPLSCGGAPVLGVVGWNSGPPATAQSTSGVCPLSPDLLPHKLHPPQAEARCGTWQAEEVKAPASPRGQQLLPHSSPGSFSGPQAAPAACLPAAPWVGLVGGNWLLPVSPPQPKFGEKQT